MKKARKELAEEEELMEKFWAEVEEDKARHLAVLAKCKALYEEGKAHEAQHRENLKRHATLDKAFKALKTFPEFKYAASQLERYKALKSDGESGSKSPRQ